MPFSIKCLCQGVCKLQICLYWYYGNLAELHPVLDVVVVDVDVFGSIRLRLSAGPFNTTSIIFENLYVIRALILKR